MPRVTAVKARQVAIVLGDALQDGFVPEQLALYKADGTPLDPDNLGGGGGGGEEEFVPSWGSSWDEGGGYPPLAMVKHDNALWIQTHGEEVTGDEPGVPETTAPAPGGTAPDETYTRLTGGPVTLDPWPEDGHTLFFDLAGDTSDVTLTLDVNNGWAERLYDDAGVELEASPNGGPLVGSDLPPGRYFIWLPFPASALSVPVEVDLTVSSGPGYFLPATPWEQVVVGVAAGTDYATATELADAVDDLNDALTAHAAGDASDAELAAAVAALEAALATHAASDATDAELASAVAAEAALRTTADLEYAHIWRPSQDGLLAANFDPLIADAASAIDQSRTVYVRVPIPKGLTLTASTKVRLMCSTAGATVTLAKTGILDSGGTLRAISANETAMFGSSGAPKDVPTPALVNPTVLTGGVDAYCWVALLFAASTNPQFRRGAAGNHNDALNMGSVKRFALAPAGGVTDIPSSLPAIINYANPYWAGIL